MAAYCTELEAHNILLDVHQDYPLPTPTLYLYAFIISINFLTAQRGLFPYLTVFFNAYINLSSHPPSTSGHKIEMFEDKMTGYTVSEE